MTEYDFDPIAGTEIMGLLNIDPRHLTVPRTYQKLKDVVSYFKGNRNTRSEILRVLSGKQGDPLDTLWTYTALNKEKQAKLAVFDPNDFEKDVAEEIVKGHITITTRKKLLSEIQKEKAKQDRINKYEETLNKLEDIEQQLTHY